MRAWVAEFAVRRAIAPLAICAALAAAAPATAGARPDSEAVLSPLAMSIAERPNPVLGADGRNHLAYEISIVNQSPLEVTIDEVQPIADGRPLGAPLVGPDLGGLLRVNGGGGPVLGPGGSGTLFMDVTYGARRQVPERLTHDISLTARDPSGEQPDQAIDFVGVPTSVGQKSAIEVRPPLRGPGWVAANGCCNPINTHRGAQLSIDGTVHIAERFAIDFVQIDANGRMFEGPQDQLSSYPFYGARVRSATRGRVVRIQDGQPEQVPGALPSGQTVQTAGGNYVVVKIARRRFAFYAHLQPDRLAVERGDRVRPGEVLGRLGNTGNTDAPHLHFHVMDGASPLQSNGLPFVFDRFAGGGRVTNIEAVQAGEEVAAIDPDALAGTFRSRMPLGDQLVDFAGR